MDRVHIQADNSQTIGYPVISSFTAISWGNFAFAQFLKFLMDIPELITIDKDVSGADFVLTAKRIFI